MAENRRFTLPNCLDLNPHSGILRAKAKNEQKAAPE